MPKNLTDVSQWATVAVPIGTDPATASSVETTFQLLTDRSRLLFDLLLGMRLGNWSQGDVSDITGGTFCSGANVMDICHDPNEDRFWAIDDDGAVVVTLAPSMVTPPNVPGGGPHHWYDEMSDPLDLVLWAASGTEVEIAAGGGMIVAVSDSGTDQLARSIGILEAWAAQSPAVASVYWCRAVYDPTSSLFVISGRVAGTPTKVETSPDGATWTDRTSGAGFTVNGATPRAIASDPAGVLGTLILTDTEYAFTDDGVSYGQGSHGLGSVPLALAYAGTTLDGESRWVAVLTNGDVAYSEDKGSSWTAVSSPFLQFVATYVRIAADGQGGLVASCANATRSILWASSDWGENWTEVFRSPMIDAMESGPCFGGGHFAAIGCLSGGTVAAMHSLRILEL